MLNFAAGKDADVYSNSTSTIKVCVPAIGMDNATSIYKVRAAKGWPNMCATMHVR